jgi:hypothetical protein
MTRRCALRRLAAMSILLPLFACGEADTDDFAFFYTPYHYALKAEVETPAGIRSGSSVIEVKWSYRSFKVKGEAVAVDLPNGQTLFVLLRSPSSEDWASRADESMDFKPDTTTSEAYWKRIADDRGIYPVKRRRITAIENSDNYPYFVRFREIQDPTSVELINPDNLAATFGPGYRLKSLTVQFTDAPVTHGVEKRLPWLEEVGRERGSLIPNPPRVATDKNRVALITPGDFSTELYK